jgi:hypothetical protein
MNFFQFLSNFYCIPLFSLSTRKTGRRKNRGPKVLCMRPVLAQFLFQCSDSMHWFSSLIQCSDSLLWFSAPIQWSDSMLRFSGLIHWSVSMLRFSALFYWSVSMLRFSALVQCSDSVLWFSALFHWSVLLVCFSAPIQWSDSLVCFGGLFRCIAKRGAWRISCPGNTNCWHTLFKMVAKNHREKRAIFLIKWIEYTVFYILFSFIRSARLASPLFVSWGGGAWCVP